MKQIKSVTIKSESGYFAIQNGYKDTLVLSSDTIKYHYKPTFAKNLFPERKWSYKTNNIEYKEIFDNFSKNVEQLILNFEEPHYLDAGYIGFTIKYDDNSNIYAETFTPSDEFDEVLSLIRTVVPNFEQMPAVLDYELLDDELLEEE